MGEGMLKKDRFARWLAYRLPRRIIYFAVVRAGVAATAGRWSNTEVPALTVIELLSRCHAIIRDGDWMVGILTPSHLAIRFVQWHAGDTPEMRLVEGEQSAQADCRNPILARLTNISDTEFLA